MTKSLILFALLLSGCKSKSLDRPVEGNSAAVESAVAVPYFDIDARQMRSRSVRKLGVLVGGDPVAWDGARLFSIDADGGVILKCFDMEAGATITGIPTTSCIATIDRRRTPRSTHGSATTASPSSPAITGDGNVVTYPPEVRP